MAKLLLIILVILAMFVSLLSLPSGESQAPPKLQFSVEEERILALWNGTAALNFSARNTGSERLNVTVTLENKDDRLGVLAIERGGNWTFDLPGFSTFKGRFNISSKGIPIKKTLALKVKLQDALFMECDIVASFIPAVSAKLAYPCENNGTAYLDIFLNSTLAMNFTNYSPYKCSVAYLGGYYNMRINGLSAELRPFESTTIYFTIRPPKKLEGFDHVARLESFYMIQMLENAASPTLHYGFDVVNNEMVNETPVQFFAIYYSSAVVHLARGVAVDAGEACKLPMIVRSSSAYSDVTLSIKLVEGEEYYEYSNANVRLGRTLQTWNATLGAICEGYSKTLELDFRLDEISVWRYYLVSNLTMDGQSLHFLDELDIKAHVWLWGGEDASMPVKNVGERYDIFHVKTSSNVTEFRYEFFVDETPRAYDIAHPHKPPEELRSLGAKYVHLESGQLDYYARVSWDYQYFHSVRMHLVFYYGNVTYWSASIMLLGAYRDVAPFVELLYIPIAVLLASVALPAVWRIKQ